LDLSGERRRARVELPERFLCGIYLVLGTSSSAYPKRALNSGLIHSFSGFSKSQYLQIKIEKGKKKQGMSE